MHRQSEGVALEAARPAAPPLDALRQLADFIDRRPVIVLPVWIVAYFTVLWRPAHRPLWYDELFTYYVSMSPTWERFWGSVRFVDLNPPLGYLFVRSSIALFGDTPFTARIPSMLAFLFASLLTSHLISRRFGGGFGLATLGIFWSFSLTSYAVEVRCYGILIAFFCTAAWCWLRAAESSGWTKWHAGLAIAITSMFLTHCFSPPFAAAIGAGELVRTMVARRIDKRVWAALLAPLIVLPFYVPLVSNVRQVITPVAFQSTLISIPKFYLAILAPLLPAIGMILLYWLATHRRGARLPWGELAKPHEIAFSIAAFLAPSITISYCIYSGLPFWPRHGIGAVLGGTLMVAGLLAGVARRNSKVAVAAAGLILIAFCVTKAGTGKLIEEYENTSTAYRTIRPELPFVTASGLTFLEMDHREGLEFINRLYYLTDKESAVRYHTNIFEWLPVLQRWFPVRAHVAGYRDFASKNHRFLVLATRGFPEDWLLQKLRDDGAQIRLIQELKTGYRDHELYEVTVWSKNQNDPRPE
jgi:hypothetical protein